jgi:Ca2+-transporting ATPase
MNENFYALTGQQVITWLKTDSDRGLTSQEVKNRLGQYGTNELPREKPPNAWWLFLRQFNSRLIYVLFAAAGISFFSGRQSDAYGILFAVLVDAIFGFWQERKAEHALTKLRQMIVQEVTVVRDGAAQRVPSAEVVPGDIIMLNEGDRVMADARLLFEKDLRTDEAALTGESTSVKKSIEPVKEGTARPDMSCMVWLGTTVVSGVARAVVVNTGLQTAFGNIASSLQSVAQEKAPLEARIDIFGQRLGLISIILALPVFLLGWFGGVPIFEMFYFVVALIVSVIPEGLPAVLAVVLAIGVRRMAKRNAIIRHVPSVETLGVADIICTDKTGTLTENKMTVREVYADGRFVHVSGEGWKSDGKFISAGQRIRPAEHSTLNFLLKIATICNKATLVRQAGRETIMGDPTEGALVVLGAKAGLDKYELIEEYHLIDEVLFSSARMYRAMLVDNVDLEGHLERYIFVVGAYEVLRERSKDAAFGDGRCDWADVEADFQSASDRFGGKALRVLAVGYRRQRPEDQTIDDKDVSDLTLLGLIGMIDPPRAGVSDAVTQCRSAGVRIIMVTGDQRVTAAAIAREIGLGELAFDENGVCPGVYTETEVAHMNAEQFDRALNDAVIFARVSPATKLRIVDRLEDRGHIVAMTGDGINDAPALKRAAIGVAMGITGTDVSKEVADMVLADDNFVSIVGAIEEGRIIFRNIKQTVAYLFMTNVGEVVTVLASLAAGFSPPLLPAQILWMNLVTDGLPDVALATERRHGNVLKEAPRSRITPILSRGMLVLTLLTSLLMCFGTLVLFWWELRIGDLTRARTVAFTTMAMFQLWNVFNMRSDKESLFNIGFFSNKWVTWAVSGSIFLQLAVLYVPFLQNIFRTVPINWFEWVLIAIITSTVLWLVEGYKWLIRHGFISSAWLY